MSLSKAWLLENELLVQPALKRAETRVKNSTYCIAKNMDETLCCHVHLNYMKHKLIQGYPWALSAEYIKNINRQIMPTKTI